MKSQRKYRAMRIAVFAPDMDRAEFCKLLLDQFRQSTRAANRVIQMLFRHDYTPQEMEEKINAYNTAKKKNETPENASIEYPAALNLYEEIRKIFPNMDVNTVAALTHTVRAKYMKTRRGFYIHMNDRFPFYAFPAPIIQPKQAYDVEHTPDGKLLVHLKLGRTKNNKPQKVTLELDNSESYAYHRRGVIEAQTQRKKFGTLQLELKPAGEHEKRFTIMRRDKNRNRKYYRLIVSIPVELAVKSRHEYKPKIVIIHTDDEHFIVVRDSTSDRKPWCLNEDSTVGYGKGINPDEIKRQIERDDHLRQRLNEDKKFHRKNNHYKGIKGYINRKTDKNSRRFGTWTHELVAQIIAHVEAERATEVYFCIDQRTTFPHFPWFMLKSKLQSALDETGIVHHDLKNRPENDDWIGAYRALNAELAKTEKKTAAIERERQTEAALAIQPSLT